MGRFAGWLTMAIAILTVLGCSALDGTVRMPGTSRNRSYAYPDQTSVPQTEESDVAPTTEEDHSLLGDYPSSVQDVYWRTSDSFEGTVDHGVAVAQTFRTAEGKYTEYSSSLDAYISKYGAFRFLIRSSGGEWSPLFRYDVVYNVEPVYPHFSSVAFRIGDDRWDYELGIDYQDPEIARETGYAWMDLEAIVRIAIDPRPAAMRLYSENARPLTYELGAWERAAIHHMLRVVLSEDFGNELTVGDLDAMLEGYLEEISKDDRGA